MGKSIALCGSPGRHVGDLCMLKEYKLDAVRRLQALIARETGAPLGEAAQAEMSAILRECSAPEGVATSGLPDQPREVTILLADLRGFTALSAQLPAGIVITALNRCLVRLSEVVAKYQGSIDKFMGDSIMVLFGAPVARPDDVERAVQCAIEMQIAMRDLNYQHREEGLPQVFLGVGVNTGSVMAGRFGSDVYSEYTVIGDEVNLTSRIEAFSLRGQVLISEATYQRCWGLVSASAPMQVHVKGRAQPVALRELVAIPSRKLKVPRQEFRRSHRVEACLPCLCQRMQDKIVVPEILHATARDIGYHGMLLELAHPLELHTELKLEFTLALVNSQVSDVYARVVAMRQEGPRWLAGLEFTSIQPETHSKVQMFVQLMVGNKR